MTDRDDVKQPNDHLPPKEERDQADAVEEPRYPGQDGVEGDSPVNPETAAEPDRPLPHGVDKMRPSGR
jgi:hypothetical protein